MNNASGTLAMPMVLDTTATSERPLLSAYVLL